MSTDLRDLPQPRASGTNRLLPFIVLLLAGLAGAWISLASSRELRREAEAAWLALAERRAAESTEVANFWLQQGFTLLRGVADLVEASDILPSDALARAVEVTAGWGLDVELDPLAFVQPVAGAERAEVESEMGVVFSEVGAPGSVAPDASESFAVRASTGGELLAVGADLATAPALREVVFTAVRIPGEVVMGPTFEGPDGVRYTLLGIAARHFSTDGVIVGLLDLGAFVSDLESLYVPTGISLRLAERDTQSGVTVTVKPVIGPVEAPAGTVRTVSIRIAHSQAPWELNWDVTPAFLTGPETRFADAVAYGGLIVTVLVAIVLGILSREYLRSRVLVERRTRQLASAEDRLTRSERRLLSIIEQTPFAVAIVAGSTVLYANRRFYELFRTTEEQTVGLDSAGLFVDRADRDTLRNRLRRTDQVGEAELELQRADRTRFWALVSAQPFEHEGAPALLTTIFDITDLKRAQDVIEAARDAAEEANRAKSAFLANMSHEIRTPMTAIIGMTRLALDTALTPRQRDYLGKAEAASRGLLAIIDDILDFSKVEAGKLVIESVYFDLDEVLARLEAVVGLQARDKGLALEFDLAPDVPRRVIGDPHRLGQVLVNLVSNAIRFTQRGGVRVEVSLGACSDTSVQLAISVIDTGVGMTDAQRARLFEPFTQADESITRRYGGTGLGLAISRELVELMGGRIGIDAAAGQGTVVRFDVRFAPAADDEAPAPVPAAATARSDAARVVGARVLLVEDNPINRQIVVELLERAGVEIDSVMSGEAALGELEGTRRHDAVLMDLQMPGMDGFETTRQIRERFAADDLPVIALSAHALADEREACLRAGMNDHVAKPIEPGELLRTLERWLPALHAAAPAASAGVVEASPPGVPDLPNVDVEDGVARASGDVALYRDLLEAFAEGHADVANAIAEALEAGSVATARRLAHDLRSVAGSLGAGRIAEQAGVIERMLAASEEVARERLRELDLEVRALCEAIGRDECR